MVRAAEVAPTSAQGRGILASVTTPKLHVEGFPSGSTGERRPAGAATACLTAAALLAFAGNSLLCRLALGSGLDIDPFAFTLIRLASGAALLWGLSTWRRDRPAGDWRGGLLLFAYALPFSLAYASLPTGTGALLLFGSGQLTMLVAGLRLAERPGARGWFGIATAFLGLVVLTFPGLAAPSPGGALLMLAAGVAWGFYSLHGRHSAPPLPATAGNFLRATPLAVLAWAAARFLPEFGTPPDFGTSRGVQLALLSGAITSGLGYVLWYAALPRLGAIRAAVVQLAVPVLAAVGGVVFLSERVTPRLLAASCLVLGGLALALGRSNGRRMGPGVAAAARP
jgi:drug/metabolite transporter (DMT)-like permease